MSSEHPATLEVRALDALDLPELRKAWEARFGAPPITRSGDLLRTLLAWRIQAEAFGGLDRAILAALRRAIATPASSRLPEGTRLAREWRGVRHEVEVVDGGFHHQGRTYRSLSQAARAITGVQWNGPRFFGLRAAPSS
jgi:hypothetical protein